MIIDLDAKVLPGFELGAGLAFRPGVDAPHASCGRLLGAGTPESLPDHELARAVATAVVRNPGSRGGWTLHLTGIYIPFMRSKAPDLLPIFRSKYQAEVLAWLYLHPDTEYTISQLAERFGIAQSTLHREVERLTAAGLIRDRTVGRTRLLAAATDHRAAAPLTQLLAVTFGPVTVVAEEFATVAGAESVHIYGSWAARYEGVPGAPPSDVDVLVVGQPTRTDVYAASDRAQDRLGIPVNPSIRTQSQWRDQSDSLVQQIQASPFVTVLDLEAR
jgi:DNA-binding transcriptional ArsR family regulator